MLGSTAPGPGQADPLAESLVRFQPSRVRPPGVVHQYDNFGMALAGHLVEDVTGQSFEEYVTGHILGPLGMTRSTYGQPVADAHDVTALAIQSLAGSGPGVAPPHAATPQWAPGARAVWKATITLNPPAAVTATA